MMFCRSFRVSIDESSDDEDEEEEDEEEEEEADDEKLSLLSCLLGNAS